MTVVRYIMIHVY